MKQDIHPAYGHSEVRCACGARFVTRATTPDIHVEVCSECHPFYTGKQKFVDSGGRVDRFRQRQAKTEKLQKTASKQKR